MAFAKAIGRGEAFAAAPPEARLGPLPVCLFSRKKKKKKQKRELMSCVVDFMREEGIEMRFAIPRVDTHVFEEERVLEAWDVPRPNVALADYFKSWSDVLARVCACGPVVWEDCPAEVDWGKSAGEPWGTTKEAVWRELEKKNVDPIIWLSDSNHRDLVTGLFQRHTKEELREWLDEFRLKDPHSISGIEFFAQLMQVRYCSEFNTQLYAMGSSGQYWFAPGMSFFHGEWDVLSHYLGQKDRAYLCFDFKTNNETHDYVSHCAIRGARAMLWKDPETLQEARRVWDFDWESLVVLPSGIVVPARQLNSGSYNTTVANTLQVKGKWDKVVELAERKAGVFMKGRRDKIAGDDGICAFDASQADIFRPEFIIACALELGMQLKCRLASDLSGAEFCSHTFVKVRGSYVAAPVDASKVFCSLAYPPQGVDPSQTLSRFVAQQIRTAPLSEVFLQVQRVTERFVSSVPLAQRTKPFEQMLDLARKTPMWWMTYVHLGKLEASAVQVPEGLNLVLDQASDLIAEERFLFSPIQAA